MVIKKQYGPKKGLLSNINKIGPLGIILSQHNLIINFFH